MSQLYSSVAGKIDASMVVLATGAPLVAGTVHCFVKRDSDGKWLKADTTWTADTTKPTGDDIPTMTHVSGGLWTLAHTPAAADYYNVNCIDSPVTCFPDNRTEKVNSFDSFKANVSGLSTFNPAADEVKLTADYDAAKTAAPTVLQIRQEMDSNSTQLAAIVGYLDTEIAAIEAALVTIAGYTDSLEGSATTIAGYTDTVEASLTTLLGRMTSVRAGYLDKLNITGNVAAESEATANKDEVIAALPNNAPGVEDIDNQLSSTHGSGLWGGSSPDDVILTHNSLNTNGNAIGITTAGASIAAYLRTDTARTTPLRKTVAEVDGEWSLAVSPSAEYTLVFRKNRFKKATAEVDVL